MKDAIVIGGGFGGIAASLRLRAKGYNVELFERRAEIGGRAQVFKLDGFTHDAGPTVITAPFLFEELFNLFGKKLSDYITLVPVDPWYRFYFPDGTQFDYGGTLEDTLSEISKFDPSDTEGYLKLLKHSQHIFEVAFDELSDQPFHEFSLLFKTTPSLVKLKSYKTVWQLVSTYLKNEKLRQAFSIQPLLLGGNPFDTTCIYSLIHFLERKWGIYFPIGGTGALVQALKKLMGEEGIKITTNSTIEKIVVENKVTKGVMIESGRKVSADIVVSNADPMHMYDCMISTREQSITARVKQRLSKISMGLYVLYFGTRETYSDVAHHTIWMGARYKELLKDIFDRKILADDFSLYLHRPTATDPSFAPAGCDSFYVLCPVPNLLGSVDWKIEGPLLQERIVNALGNTILPDLASTICSSFFMTPEDFKENYLTAFGSGFSVAPTFKQSAWFRFHNKAEGPKNLFLVGAGTHPGAGLPGVISSAKVVDKMIPRSK
tara:strand:- start:1345 stop:2817 length:1473 start_codon:yes stop_codon:yes gene_type:complete